MAADVSNKILLDIKNTSERHEQEMLAEFQRVEVRYNKERRERAADKSQQKPKEDFARKQQGQEVQLSKKGQFYQEQVQKQTDDLERFAETTAEALEAGVISTEGKGAANILTEQKKENEEEAKDRNEKKEFDKKKFKEDKAMWMNRFKEEVREGSTRHNLLGAMKTDMSLIFGSLGTLTSLPGVQTILTGIKTLLFWFIKKIFPKWMADTKKDKKDDEELSKDKEAEIIEKKELTPEQQMGAKLRALEPEKEEVPYYDTASIDLQQRKTAERSEEAGGMFTKMGESLKKFGDNVKEKLVPFNKKSGEMWGAFKTSSKNFIASMWNSIKAMALNAVALLASSVTMIGFTLPIWAIIAGILILAAGLVILGIYLYKNWETIKEKWNEGVDKLKEFGTNVKNWFSDAATEIGLKVKMIIAKMKDGISSIGNSIIEGLNEKKKDWLGGEDIIDFRFGGGGAVAGVERERAEFEAMKANRGKEVADASAAVRSAQDGLSIVGGGGNKTSNIASVTSTTSRPTYVATGTRTSDSYANAQNVVNQ